MYIVLITLCITHYLDALCLSILKESLFMIRDQIPDLIDNKILYLLAITIFFQSLCSNIDKRRLKMS